MLRSKNMLSFVGLLSGLILLFLLAALLLPWQSVELAQSEFLARRALLPGVLKSAIRLTANAGNAAEEALAAKALVAPEESGR